jgi:hypothetical protein
MATIGALLASHARATECSIEGLGGLAVAGIKVTAAGLVPASPPKQEYCDVKGSAATDGEGAGASAAGGARAGQHAQVGGLCSTALTVRRPRTSKP